MKFVALAVTAAAALASVADATRLAGKFTSNEEFTSKLMANAKPYGRELNDNQNVQLTGAYSVIFKSCETLSVQADFQDNQNNNNNNNQNGDDAYMSLQEMYQNGAIRAQASYILFDVCLSDECSKGSAYRTTYITDMASFINAFVGFIPTKQAQYCEGCQNNYDYCAYQSQQAQAANGNGQNNGYYTGQDYQADGGYNGNGAYSNNYGGRKLANGQLVEYIDCDRCSAYGCWAGNTADYALAWIQSMAACEQSENPYYFNGQEVSMGFMCNADGSGVEVAAFLDDTCTLYTNAIAYGNILSQQDYVYWYKSREHMEYMFSSEYSCYDPEVYYINPDDEAAGTYGDDLYGDDANGEEPEAAEWCQMAFAGTIAPVSMADCGANNNNRKLDEAAADEYTQVYTLAEEDIQDGSAVCTALTGLGGEGEHLYDKKNSGSMYKYNGKMKYSGDWQDELDRRSNMSKGMKTVGKVFLSLFIIAVVAGGITFWLLKKGGMQTIAVWAAKAKIPGVVVKRISSGDVDKKEPILNKDEKGQLA